jgi:hypothetical protein
VTLLRDNIIALYLKLTLDIASTLLFVIHIRLSYYETVLYTSSTNNSCTTFADGQIDLIFLVYVFKLKDPLLDPLLNMIINEIVYRQFPRSL